MKRKTLTFILLIINFIITFSFAQAQQHLASHQSPELFEENQSIIRGLLGNVFAHTEPASETNPADADNIIVAFNSTYPQTNPTTITQGIKYSTDAGLTWTTIDELPNANSKGYAGDPGIAFTSEGTVYVSYIGYGSGQDEVRYNS